jgi:phosphoglycerate dehydrogenase-like enzyme
VDRVLAVPELRARDEVLLTNMQGMHGPTIGDHVFAMLLQLTRGLDAYGARQAEGRWDRSSPPRAPTALAGRRLLVVGLGGIGTEVARRGDAFGMDVWAIDRTQRPGPAFVDRTGTPADLDAWLAESDVVVLCVPLTEETRGMMSRERLLATRPGAFLVNIARGPVVDTDGLVEALEAGHLGGACLDVTDPEPLPEGHPLWAAPNVVITPHVAGWSESTGERVRDLFRENLRRFGAGEPLLNVVDKAAGY